MGRNLKSIGTIVLSGMFLIAANLGGTSGCGGGSEGGGGSTGETAEQEQLSLANFKSTLDVGVQAQIQLLALAGLFVQGATKDQAATSCSVSGDYTTTVDATSVTLDFNSCDFGCEVAEGALVFTFADGISTLNDMSITPDFADAFTLSGTSDANDALTEVAFTLTATSASDEVAGSGTVTVNDDGTFSGTITFTSGSTTVATCTLDHFSGLTGTISDLASACGVDAPTCS